MWGFILPIVMSDSLIRSGVTVLGIAHYMYILFYQRDKVFSSTVFFWLDGPIGIPFPSPNNNPMKLTYLTAM